ncbi:MAG TPA: hypothetical protein VGS03_12065 [Candidatus Polarisedimenticolia bacterium]|nr:hypothetical protein [Candidatus Polarisedimenticolia bacterium]
MTARQLPLVPALQSIIERTYGLEPLVGDVAPYLIGDAGLRAMARAGAETAGEPGRPRLLLRPEGEGMRAVIYYPDALVTHLERHDPRRGLDDRNIDAFAMLVEELDHLLTVASRLASGRPLRLLELEMHALVTKYLVVLHLLGRLTGRRRISEFHRAWTRHHLFEKYADGGDAESVRYLEAARLASRYVRWLDRLTAVARHAELRRFHARPFAEQTRHIALAG